MDITCCLTFLLSCIIITVAIPTDYGDSYVNYDYDPKPAAPVKTAVPVIQKDAPQNDVAPVLKREPSCTGDWKLFNNSCYMVQRNRLSYYEAKQRCEEYGSYLATIHSQKENDFIYSLAHTGNVNTAFAWIGMTAYDKASGVWDNVEPTDYLNWASATMPDSGECVQLLQDELFGTTGQAGKWVKRECNQNGISICKRDARQAWSDPKLAVASDMNWTTGWKAYGGSQYKLITRRAPFYDAVSQCKEHGGYLVTIANAQENDFVYSVIDAELKYQFVWIGLTGDLSSWASNGEPVTFTAWGHPLTPQIRTREQGIIMAQYPQAKVWNEFPNYGMFPFVCEKKA